MRDILTRSGAAALIAGLALAVSACGGGSQEANETSDSNMLDSNALFEEPANDASAMESVTNVEEPMPDLSAPGNASETSNEVRETEGGDTGGNTVESNVSGM